MSLCLQILMSHAIGFGNLVHLDSTLTNLLRSASEIPGGPYEADWEWDQEGRLIPAEDRNCPNKKFPYCTWQADGYADLDAYPGFASRVFPCFWNVFWVNDSWRAFLTNPVIQDNVRAFFSFLGRYFGQTRILYCQESWELDEICLRSGSFDGAVEALTQKYGPPCRSLQDIIRTTPEGHFWAESFFVEDLK